jgi:hypothetical protein
MTITAQHEHTETVSKHATQPGDSGRVEVKVGMRCREVKDGRIKFAKSMLALFRVETLVRI